jgi:alpha-mannosidase
VNLEQRLKTCSERLRQFACFDLLPGWDALTDGHVTLDPVRRLLVWPRGQEPRTLRQTWQVPPALNGLPLQGATVRLKVLWWADWAEIWANGTRLYEGDLFDRDCRLLLVSDLQVGDTFTFEIGLNSPAHDDGALQTSQLLFEYPHRACDPGKLADELAVLRACLHLFRNPTVDWDTILDRLEALLANPPELTFWAELHAIRNSLLPLGKLLKQRTVYLLGNAHIDVAWLWPIAETRQVVRRTFQSVLSLQHQYLQLTFNQSTALSYQWIEESHPEIFRQIQAAVAAGRWELTGGMWVEPDCNLPSGEALVRQILYGKSYFRERFQQEITIAWMPDSFGFCWQLPQILAKSGFRVFITQKLSWNDTHRFPHRVFFWEGLDGSRILTYFCNEIGQGIDPEAIATQVSGYEQQHGLDCSLWLFGVGDHGGGPTADMLDLADCWADSEFFFTLKHGTAEQFADDLQQDLDAAKLPIWRDELYLELHRGVYTSKADQKRQNRQLEFRLRTVEQLRAIAALTGRLTYPFEELTAAWQGLLTNQFHDILPGSAIPEVFEDADRTWADIRNTCTRLVDEIDALDSNAGDGQSPTGGHRLCLWNGHNWPRSELVELEGSDDCDLNGVTAVLQESTQTLLPIQSVEDGLLFRANVPSVGWESFACVRDDLQSDNTARQMNAPVALEVSPKHLENAYLRVELDSETGTIVQLHDKQTGQLLLSGPADLQLFEDGGQYWDAWNIDPEYEHKQLDELQFRSLQVLETGPLRVVIRVIRTFRQSTIQQDIQLEADAAFLTVRTEIDWQEEHVLLKASFPLSFTAEFATYEIPFGAIARPTCDLSSDATPPVERAKWEVPAHHWADMSGAGIGLSVLNDCKYGYDAKPGQLRLSLLRSPTWPHPTSDRGHHSFSYRLVPHRGDWRAAGVVALGYDFNNPLAIYPSIPHSPQSLFSTSSANIILTAFKPAENRSGWIVRWYESWGQKGLVTIRTSWPLSSVRECDLVETPISNFLCERHSFDCEFQPYEIKTFHLQFFERSGLHTV